MPINDLHKIWSQNCETSMGKYEYQYDGHKNSISSISRSKFKLSEQVIKLFTQLRTKYALNKKFIELVYNYTETDSIDNILDKSGNFKQIFEQLTSHIVNTNTIDNTTLNTCIQIQKDENFKKIEEFIKNNDLFTINSKFKTFIDNINKIVEDHKLSEQEIKNTLSNILCNLFEKHGLPLDIYEAFYEDNIYTESIKDLDLIYYNIYNDKEYQDTLKQVEYHKLKFTENIQQILDNIKQGAIRYEEEKKKETIRYEEEKKKNIKSLCIKILQNEATLHKIIDNEIERPSKTKIKKIIQQIEDDCKLLTQDKDLYFINNYGTRSYLYSCNYKAILKYFIKSELEHVSDVDVKNDYELLNKNSWDSAIQEALKMIMNY